MRPIALQGQFTMLHGIAIDAAELASAIRVDGPAKTQRGIVASIENLAHRHLDKLDVA